MFIFKNDDFNYLYYCSLCKTHHVSPSEKRVSEHIFHRRIPANNIATLEKKVSLFVDSISTRRSINWLQLHGDQS